MKHPTIIDCHTHVYPDELARAPREWASKRGEQHWADLVAPKDRKSIQAWADPETMLADMDHSGVKQSVLLGWYWTQEASCRWHNEVMARWRETAPERFIAFAAIYPNESVIDQLEAARTLGFCGVGELHFGLQSFTADNPYWQAMAEWCSAHNWPVNFHVTEAVSSAPNSVPTPLAEFVRMAEQHPKLQMILAHWGGGLAFFEQNPRIRKILKNVYYDAAASPLLYDFGIFRRMIDLVGIEKLVFGSDYPLRLFPKTQKQANMDSFIAKIKNEADLTELELQHFFRRNFARIIGQTSNNA